MLLRSRVDQLELGLAALESRDIAIARVLLHVGAGTFRPVEVEDPALHPMHEEWYEISNEAAACMNEVVLRGGRLWAVGTTVTRTLESAAGPGRSISAGCGWTGLFIRPGYRWLLRYRPSVLLADGVDVRTLAEYLGHADPGFTLRTYCHLLPSSEDRTRRAVDRAFSGETAVDGSRGPAAARGSG